MHRWPRCLVPECPNLPAAGRTLCRSCRRSLTRRLNRAGWIPAQLVTLERGPAHYAGGRGSVHGTGKGVNR